jgi:hypothetical protein
MTSTKSRHLISAGSGLLVLFTAAVADPAQQVVVANTPLPTVLAPEPIRQEAFGISEEPDTSGSVLITGVFTVPAGKRAVVEHVSFQIEVPSGQRITSVLVGTSFFGVGVGTQDFLVPTFLGTSVGGSDQFAGSQPVRMYFEPGSEITFSAARSSSVAGTMRAEVRISGYLYPVP